MMLSDVIGDTIEYRCLFIEGSYPHPPPHTHTHTRRGVVGAYAGTGETAFANEIGLICLK